MYIRFSIAFCKKVHDFSLLIKSVFLRFLNESKGMSFRKGAILFAGFIAYPSIVDVAEVCGATRL